MIGKELLNYMGAAEYLGLSPLTLRRYVSRRLVPYLKLGPSAVRFTPEDLDHWLESRKVNPLKRKPE
jgi:excisionase family DNA binding protein